MMMMMMIMMMMIMMMIIIIIIIISVLHVYILTQQGNDETRNTANTKRNYIYADKSKSDKNIMQGKTKRT